MSDDILRDSREQDDQFQAALDEFGLEYLGMGGDCEALSYAPRQGWYALIYSTEYELTPPTSLDEPVTVYEVEEDGGEDGSDLDHPGRAWPSFRAFLIDLYGAPEGADIPECLK